MKVTIPSVRTVFALFAICLPMFASSALHQQSDVVLGGNFDSENFGHIIRLDMPIFRKIPPVSTGILVESSKRGYSPLQFGKRDRYQPLQFGKRSGNKKDYQPGLQFGKRGGFHPLQFGKKANYTPLQFGKRAAEKKDFRPLQFGKRGIKWEVCTQERQDPASPDFDYRCLLQRI